MLCVRVFWLSRHLSIQLYIRRRAPTHSLGWLHFSSVHFVSARICIFFLLAFLLSSLSRLFFLRFSPLPHPHPHPHLPLPHPHPLPSTLSPSPFPSTSPSLTTPNRYPSIHPSIHYVFPTATPLPPRPTGAAHVFLPWHLALGALCLLLWDSCLLLWG
ncbi:hypothetical protein C8F04DRAFT_1119112 [Mycena alexandri]|uniref:Uncharacterized protein n=1 Tax=Mycena alexandri TaxID=1745969 RepID=A0AAD6SKI6_9AGAR|nr:hypothetical protein C8F04DRAFT_1119112 [Mycena alexandri]